MSTPSIAVAISARDSTREQRLAERLGLPQVKENVGEDYRYLLAWDDEDRLTLSDATHARMKPVYAEFMPRHDGRGPDPLLRALGADAHRIVDCTAGLGVDAAHLAASGRHVTAIESHPVLHALLADALERCAHAGIRTRLELVHADARQWLTHAGERPDAIYLDPMYPPRPGSAAPRKGIRLLQSLVDHDPESDRDLLGIALDHARRRVVVKRPHHADPLLPGPRGETRGKLVRFDIYRPTTESRP